MESELHKLLVRLSLIGYRNNEINRIALSAGESANELLEQLARYEQLGLDYINNYSQ